MYKLNLVLLIAQAFIHKHPVYPGGHSGRSHSERLSSKREQISKAIITTNGNVIKDPEEGIEKAREALGRKGFYVETTADA
ncbi:hypothetical protein [Halobacillus sp. Marseille-Q1614]|uniref:hypothetical protein n=1 Tax=Halobacillus sp. Marseille-Q1614 TaxID=2709134 RepID=UPI00156D6701|nr:hypothetical protein [Halobacillus sp. Marseille-Q1614]